MLATRVSLAQCPDGSPPPCAGARPAPTPTLATIAVLPFANLSRDSGDVYLAEGLTEELISRLGAVQRFRVPGRSVVERAQAAIADPQALARRLGVRYLVEGSVRRGGSRLRVSVRLLRATDGVRVWGDDYDRSQEDLLAVQETIAREVATNVAGQLLPGEQATLTARPTWDPEAWDHFLRGNHAIGTRSARTLATALTEYQAALGRDSTFAAAQARIAYVYALGVAYGLEHEPQDSVYARGERAAQRALLLDPNSSDAWLAWGYLRTMATRGMREARTAIERAVQLDPRNAEAAHQLGQVYTFLGDDSAAIGSYRRALALEPGRAQSLYELSTVYYMHHRWRDAFRLSDSAAAENPELARAWIGRARARVFLGETAAATEDARRALRLATGDLVLAQARATLVRALAAAGDTAAARSVLAELDATTSNQGPALAVRAFYAVGLVALGDRERAIAALGAVASSDLLVWFLRSPDLDPIRSDPRFQRTEAAARAAP